MVGTTGYHVHNDHIKFDHKHAHILYVQKAQLIYFRDREPFDIILLLLL